MEFREEFVHGGFRALDAHDAGELAGEAGHAAFEPVTAMFRHRVGQRTHKTRTITTKHRHDEIAFHDGMRAERSEKARANPQAC